MSPEAQRIAIAEACGWQEVLWSDLDLISPREARERKVYCRNNAQKRCEWLPDYLNDLNAMHEAEKVLTDEQFFDWSKDKHTDMSYNGHLFRLVDNSTPGNRPCRYHSPTAAQRAEAFLRTVGKWEDDK